MSKSLAVSRILSKEKLDRMKNIAEFIISVKDGGCGTLVKNYALALDKEKFKVVIIVIYRNKQTANDRILTQNGINIIPIYRKNPASPSILYRLIKKLNSWWYIPYRLKRILQRERIEVLHIHMWLLHLVKRISRSIRGMRLLYTCHSLPRLYLAGQRQREGEAAEHLIRHNNLQMIALHEDMRIEINEMFGIENTAVIRNGIDLARFQHVPETKRSIRASLGIPENAFVAGHIGRFSEEKNHAFLVDVFEKLCKRRENAFLLMIGLGPLRLNVEEKLAALGLKGKYLILSHRTDIPQLLKAMDVFVFPSFYEGFSLALLEAQAAGLRCVVSDSINAESFLSELTLPVSLEKSSGKWCDAVLAQPVKGRTNGKIEDYDINREIRRVEQLYLGGLDG